MLYVLENNDMLSMYVYPFESSWLDDFNEYAHHTMPW